MDTPGFLTSLIVSFIIFLLLLLLYSLVLSRNTSNAVIYYPAKIIIAGASASNSPDQGETRAQQRRRLIGSTGFFSWIHEAFTVTEYEILEKAGLDATVYMIFLSSAFKICVYASIVCVLLLVPLSATGRDLERQSKAAPSGSAFSFTNFDKLGMGNVQDGSTSLWAFAFATYWLTFVVIHVLWRSYKHVVKLRMEFQSLHVQRPEQYAVLFRDILKGSESLKTLGKLYPDSYCKSIVVTPDTSKAMKMWKKLESYNKKLRHAEAVYASNNQRIRPTHKIGPLAPLSGQQVDSIQYYSQQIQLLSSFRDHHNVPRSDDIITLGNKSSGHVAAIAIFNDRRAATIAAQVMYSVYGNEWRKMAAPEAREVVWRNLAIPFTQRLIRRCAVYGIVTLTILFYMIPITFISSIISLENLEKKFPFLKPLVEEKIINTILQAFLPQLVLLIFMSLLPALLKKLSEMEGIPARSHIERSAAGKYFYFNVFNVFLGVSIAGTLFDSLNGIVKDPRSIVTLLGQSLPKQATFFISYVALQFFVGYGWTLSRLSPLIIYHLKKRYFCKTEEEEREAWYPPPFQYATCIPADLLTLTITICYSIIAPVILPFAIMYFGLGWLLMRHQALNVVIPRYESGGKMWPHMHSRILAALFLLQLTMIGYFGVKKFVYGPLLLPPLLVTLIFAYISRKFFYSSFGALTLETASKRETETLTSESIVEAYIPPCFAISNTSTTSTLTTEGHSTSVGGINKV